jgi:hypothetical protein
MTSIDGIYRDRIWTSTGPSPQPAGRSAEPTHDSGWQSNIVVTQARTALAAFMRGGVDVTGVHSILLGAGKKDWDSGGPPPPDASTTALVDPIDERKIEPAEIVFLDDDGNPTNDLTTRVQVTVTFEPGDPEDDVALREFGLFGVLDTNGGQKLYMIDYVRHPVINKGPADTLERVIRLSF